MDYRITKDHNFVIITGLSGAGKTQAMKCFEDQGYYCVDNLPPALIPKFAQLCSSAGLKRLALAVDIRSRDFFSSLTEVLQEQLPKLGITPFIFYLEADDEVLIRRFSETRRRHPMAQEERIAGAIEREKEFMAALRSQADLILDTSSMSPHKLRGRILEIFSSDDQIFGKKLHIVSFGFKYGIPLDTDLVFDCRFLPNPYYIADLKPFSGLDEQIRKYVFSFPASQQFKDKLVDLLNFLLPKFFAEGKQHVTVAFGCTGGRHRSVALAEAVAKELRSQNCLLTIEHRDMLRAEKHKRPKESALDK